MILTSHGFVEFPRARELLLADVGRPAWAYLRDGRRYRVRNIGLVGVARIRVEGERSSNPGGGWVRPICATLTLDADEIIPVIRETRDHQEES